MLRDGITGDWSVHHVPDGELFTDHNAGLVPSSGTKEQYGKLGFQQTPA